jgi:alpha-ketoglutarate-dependent 2,4-dichlorophenoxyacetate dioxygenase
LQAVRDAIRDLRGARVSGAAVTIEQHLAFASHFGPLETTVRLSMQHGEKLRVREEIADIANLDADGKVWHKNSRIRLFQMGNRLWHTDSSFKAPSGYASLLYARSVAPIGGHTEFADLRARYDALADERKHRLRGLIAEHSLIYSRGKLGFTEVHAGREGAFAPVLRPLVRRIPESGRETLYIASHIGRIRGMEDPKRCSWSRS